MRTIKFRGRDAEYRHWTYGSLFKNEVCCRIIKETATIDEKGFLDDFKVVDPKTVGEFTGFKDKNGTEIYEGDILGGHGKKHPCGEYVTFVIWNNKKGEWYLNDTWISGQRNLWRWIDKMEVTGNIHDNPELLKT